MIKYFMALAEHALERATEGASGYDLRSAMTERTIAVGERWKVSTGLHLEMPVGVEAQVRSRSGLALNHGVIVLNAPGTVDSDYRGEVAVTLINLGQKPYHILPGDRIAQLVFAPVFAEQKLDAKRYMTLLTRVYGLEHLDSTQRGSSGHGSTGR